MYDDDALVPNQASIFARQIRHNSLALPNLGKIDWRATRQSLDSYQRAIGNAGFVVFSPNLGKIMFLVDQLVDNMLQWIDGPLVRQSAGEVARECRDALWQHVSGRIRGMTAAQARGISAWPRSSSVARSTRS